MGSLLFVGCTVLCRPRPPATTEATLPEMTPSPGHQRGQTARAIFLFLLLFLQTRWAAASPGHDLSVTIVGQGIVTRIPDLSVYPEGSQVTVIAAPLTNWHFTGWSGDTVSTDPFLTFTMNADRSLSATFEIFPDTLTLSVEGAGHVAMLPTGPAYAHGGRVQLTGLSDPGWHFASWSGDTFSVWNPLNWVMRGNASITATFVENDPTIALPEGFTAEEIVTGMQEPVGMAFLPDGRLLVVERSTGHVRLLVDGHISQFDPMCEVDSVQSAFGEQGLLGIAVDPGWPARPYVYVSYTALGETIRLSRFAATGDLDNGLSDSLVIDPASRRDVLRDIEDLLEFHNGGGLHFGPDGMLYFTIGDDGDDCAAQDSTRWKGVMLRLDVRLIPPGGGPPPGRELLVPPDNPFDTDALPDRRLIYAEGLRNPFSFDIDPPTGSVFVADVGNQEFEEINILGASGQNYGWPLFEGPAPHTPECVTQFPHSVETPPIYYYERPGLAAAVISAGVYRGGPCVGCNFPPEYEGDYFFADFYQGFIRRLKKVNGVWALAPPAPGQPHADNWGMGMIELADFAVGPDGALWYCRNAVDFNPGTGGIGRIVHDRDFVGVGGRPTVPLAFAAPYPSPSHGRVGFSFDVPRASRIELEVLGVAGRRVRRLMSGESLASGHHDVSWDCRTERGAPVPPGVYFARLAGVGQVLTRRFVVMR